MELAAPGGADFIDCLPKCELHIHVEGSLEPELLFALAQRNGVSLAYRSMEALRRAYQFSRLQDFLDIYYQGMSVLRTEQDFYDLAWAYLERARRDNVRYLEMFFDPQGHTARGVPFADVINGLHGAAKDAAAQLGIEARLILCFLRHLDEADAERTLDDALDHRDKFIGVGLDSTEVGHPPEKFARVFGRARDAGLFLTAHAGEEGPPDFIWQALDMLGVERIDHGNRAIEDAALLARLARDRIPLTMCPLSNLRLSVTPDLALHPLRPMMEKDIIVTVNSDDPAYFGGGLADNYRAIRDALRLDDQEIAAIARNGWRAAFMSDDAKAAALAAFDRALPTRA
ncbi:MAG TPA: adenosine deaminase [Stellaceae bacterium]|nr:adenosine deaminase [Stellaceae bacterium]